MRRTLDWLVAAVAASSLVFAVGCDSDSTGTDVDTMADSGPGGGAGGGAGNTGGGDAPIGGGGDGAGNNGGADAPIGGTGGGDPGSMAGAPGNPEDLMADQNEWGPAGRVSFLDVPANPDAAAAAGCLVEGAQKGSGLSGVVGLVGGNGLAEFVEPDANGNVTLLVYGQALDWAAGQTVADVGVTDINLYLGSQGDVGEWLIDPASFAGGDPAGEPLIAYTDMSVAADGSLSGEPTTFFLNLPLDGLPLELQLDKTDLTGTVFVDGPGFGLANGILGGYLSLDSILNLIVALQTVCAADTPPSLCDIAGGLIGAPGTPPEGALPLLTPLLGGFDVRLDNGTPSACDPLTPDDCNAISVCLLVGMEGIVLDGVAPE